ncbi:hypothetical protein [Nitrosomonas sp. Is37]|uniref:hypothetical protein n=1 Tax=Nitrosomonas sp. Is37 TaxID=3080535 RepID=UPI00294B05A8|nr:hypothetical protein [Nitrosomonas sp. Is37]
MLDSSSTTLRGRPDLPGTARRPRVTETCGAKRSLPSALCQSLPAGSLSPILTPIHNGTARSKPSACQ